MNIGVAIAIFLTLSILLMALFCFVTKYFNYKLKKALEDKNEVYSMIEEICGDEEEQIDGQYDEFLKKRNKDRQQDKIKKVEDADMLIQMNEIKTPLKKQENQLYGVGALRRRLNGDMIPMKQQSNRSMSSLKSFRPDKINTLTNRTENSNQKQTKHDEITTHKFINKLVCYDKKGLHIFQIIVSSISKIGQGNIKEKKKLNKIEIDPKDKDFDDQLDGAGFEKGDFGCYKYQTTIEVMNMKLGEDYKTTSLKTSESKQLIELLEFNQLKHEAQITDNNQQ